MNKSTKLCQHGNTGEICRVPKCCNPAENAAMISAVIAANLLCVWQSYLERYFSVPQPKQSVPQGEVVTGNGIVDVETQHPHSRCGNPASSPCFSLKWQSRKPILTGGSSKTRFSIKNCIHSTNCN